MMRLIDALARRSAQTLPTPVRIRWEYVTGTGLIEAILSAWESCSSPLPSPRQIRHQLTRSPR
jgi:hypothetical protein